MCDTFDAQLRQGIGHFNAHRFYECHDTIEEIWLQESSDQQPFLQGLIQAAVAFFHFQQGRWGAARAMLKMSLAKLKGYPPVYRRVELGLLIEELETWRRELDQALRGTRPDNLDLAFPRIAQRRLNPSEAEI